ncbi:MAG: hypothetical protein OXT09_15350 [Myxococcales bacterium]|nr:hypothetical protein [Myxococcales bacterium]
MGSWLGGLLALGWGLGCQSAEERCKEAVEPARAAWGEYRQALQAVKDEAAGSGKKASGELEAVEKALDAKAKARADALNRPGDSAWYRTYHAARQSLCSDDATCAGLKGKVRQAEATVEEMDGRIARVEAVLTGLDMPHEPLPSVEDDFDRRAVLSTARESSGPVPEACPEPTGE